MPILPYWPYGLHSASVPVNVALYLFYVESHSDVKSITAGRHVKLVGNDLVDICG